MLQIVHRIVFALVAVVALPALAQSDPPARVGRLALIENQVFFRVDRNDQGGPATLNWPVSSGAIIETGRRGRAEIWIGSTAYRLAGDSQAEFTAVDDSSVDLRLNGGSLAVSILDRDQVDDLIVATPDGDVRFLTPGRYRVDVYSDHSELSVQAGQATFDDRGRVVPVAAGQKASRWNNGSERVDGDWDQDEFDQWVAHRENVTLASVSRRYVSPHMTGYQDLDGYGNWQTVPEYGAVWYPGAIADDWAPYRYGRWAWVAPWGWTWIDQAPWGFAPFHYGRWAMIRGRWGWVPGSHVARPVYAPALVGWIGNPGWHLEFSAGAAPAVGWFPLAPREVYVPGYRYSHNYVRQLNAGHVRDVGVIDRAERGGQRPAFANNSLPRAVTVVPANLMREGRPITRGELRQPPRAEMGRAPLARRAPDVDWLKPAPGAVRSHGEERGDSFNRPPRRDYVAPRQNVMERGAPRSEPMPGNPDRPAYRQPAPDGVNGRGPEPRHDVLRGSPEMRQQAESRGRPSADLAPVAPPPRREMPAQVPRPATPEAAPPPPNDGRRGFSRRMDDAQPVMQPPSQPVETAPVPAPRREDFRRQGDPRFEGGMPSRPPEAVPAPPSDGRRGFSRRMDDAQPVTPPPSQPAEAAPAPTPRREGFRRQGDPRFESGMPNRPTDVAPATVPVPAPVLAPPSPRREMPAPMPEARSEPRQPPRPPMSPPQEREQRRETPPPRDFQRMERPAPREAVAPPPVMRQPEMPRPAPPPEVRAPAPAPAPVAPMPQRVEPPRPQAAPQAAPQAGGQNEPRRRHGNEDDRGGR